MSHPKAQRVELRAIIALKPELFDKLLQCWRPNREGACRHGSLKGGIYQPQPQPPPQPP